MGMIDLHSHILHGFDDGPQTPEQSIEMAALYVEEGFSRVAATPHFVTGTAWAPSRMHIVQRVALLNETLRSRCIDLRVYPGMEIALDGNLERMLEADRVITIAETGYLLIELPFNLLPPGWDRMLFSLAAKGYRPIVAHPERCRQVMAEPGIVDVLAGRDIYLQANCDSFLGHYGEEVAETAFHLLGKGCLHVMATDSHDTRQRHPGTMHAAIRVLEAAVGRETLRLLTRTNPQRVMDDLPLERPEQPGAATVNGRPWRRI